MFGDILARGAVCAFFLGFLSTSLVRAQSFSDVSAAMGFAPAFSSDIPAGGIAVEDFNQDGLPDIFVTGYNQPNRLFFNQSGTAFVEDAGISATIPGVQCSAVAAADFDNDGWPDLYVGCRNGPNFLLRNLHGAGFSDVTPTALNHSASGFNSPRTDAVAWGDLDGNGYLDIFIGIYPTSSNPDLGNPDNLDRIVLNNGDGTWTNISAGYSGTALAKLGRPALAVTMSDLDFDGRPDIYVVNDKQLGNVLWHNDGPGCGGWCFSDVAVSAGADDPAFGMGIAVGDVDRDGDWDLFYSSINEQFFLRGQGTTPMLFQREASSPLNQPGIGWATIFSDFDNDGWEDAFLAIGTSETLNAVNADQLFHNLGNGQFSQISAQSGLSPNMPTQAAARIDFDADGLVDLVFGHRNYGYRLYRNIGPSAGQWLGVRLRGGGDINRDAIGALVFVDTSDGAHQIRELRAGESRGSSHQRVLNFGLGANSDAQVSVRWPNGQTRSLGSLAAGQYHEINYLPDVIFASGFDG